MEAKTVEPGAVQGASPLDRARESAAQYVAELLQERHRRDGAAWHSKDDRQLYKKFPPLDVHCGKRLWARAREILRQRGIEAETGQRSALWREAETYRTLLEAAGGVHTPEVESAFAQEHPGVMLRVVRMAISQGGSKKPKGAAPPEPALAPELREAVACAGQVAKLQSRRTALEVQIEDLRGEIAKVDRELEQYKPLMAHLRGLASAVHAIRSNPVR